MSSVLQIVRPNDTSVVLWDMNDPTGANSSEYGGVFTDLLHNPDFGSVPYQPQRQEPPGLDGGVTTFNRTGLASMTIPLRVRGTSYDNLAKAIGRLTDLLAQGGVMKWTAHGSSAVRYIDFEPSQAPALVDGRELALYLVMSQFDTPEGVELSITRQPFLRSDPLLPAANLLTNATLLRDSDGGGRPDGWSWSSASNITNEAISATAEAFQFDIATTAQRQLLQVTPNSTVVATETWCMSGYARVTSSTFTNVEVQAMIEYQTNAGAVVNTITGTLTAIGTGWTRLQVSGVASATATKAQAGLRVDPTSATSATVQLKNVQFEKQSAASDFRVTTEVVSMDHTSSGYAYMLPVYNPSDSPAPCAFTISAPDSSSAVTEIDMALRSSKRQTGERALPDFLNGPFWAPGDATANGWTVTLGTNVTDGGTYGLINHVTGPKYYQKKITWTRTTKLDALRGEHDVYAVVENTGAGAEKFYLQLRWGPTATTPVPYTLDEATHDVHNSTGFYPSPVKLGRIRIPEETRVTLSTLTFELWTHCDVGDVDLRVYKLLFVPAEEQAHLEAGPRSRRKWWGSHLTSPTTNPATGTAGGAATAATQEDKVITFDSANDTAGTPPAGGDITAVGKHVARYNIYNIDNNSTAFPEMFVRNITDTSNAADDNKQTIRRKKTKTLELEYTVVSGKTYQIQLKSDADPTTEYVLNWVEDVHIPALLQNEKLISDPGITGPYRANIEKQDSSGNLITTWEASQVPFWLPPGLSLVMFRTGDAAFKNDGRPYAHLTRTISVAPTITPMYPG